MYFLLVVSGTATTCYPSNVFPCLLKSLETFLVQNFSIVIPKNTNKTKKQGKFWSDNRFISWKILNYSNKIQNSYFWIYSRDSTQKIKLKPNQTLFDMFKSHIIFQIFQRLSKLKFLSFTTTKNPNNQNETELDIFPWGIKIWRNIFLSKKINLVLWLKWSQTMEMKQNQKFLWNIFKSDAISIFC